jgi:magnesium-transporting ATPase (P-type)
MHCLSPGLYCNDSSVTISEDETHQPEVKQGPCNVIGEPTEASITSLAIQVYGFGTIETICRSQSIEEIPFDSAAKFMAKMYDLRWEEYAAAVETDEISEVSKIGKIAATLTISLTLTHTDGKVRVIFLKGAPERVFAMSRLTEAALTSWQSHAESLGEQGMRVLGCAYKVLAPDGTLAEEATHGLGFNNFNITCLVGIADPPRDEAIIAIEAAHEAGITVKMITGDHPITACAIGRKLGLQNGTHSAVTGADLDGLISNGDMATFDEIVLHNNIFARTTPDHKLLIVKSLQRQNLSCSMTGDGVNDAPALKQANIGVAMGSGTEIAKDASDIIITDDNFATIIEAIRYGRCTYNNLVKILVFVLPTNAAQAFSIIVALIIGVEVPFTALQILWVNMITSITLGLVLAFEKPQARLMRTLPRHAGKSIFGKFVGWRVLFVATLLVGAVLGNFQWEKLRFDSLEKLRTVAVNTLSVGQVCYLFNCRHLRHSAWPPWNFLLGNPVIYLGLLGVTLAQGLFTYSTAFQSLFQTRPLDGWSWAKMLLLGFVLFLCVEVEKVLSDCYRRHHPPTKSLEEPWEEEFFEEEKMMI